MSILQRIVDAVFAFIEMRPRLVNRPLIKALLEEVRKEIDTLGIGTLAAYLQSVGLGWIVTGPQAPPPTPMPVPAPPPDPPTARRIIRVVNQSTVVAMSDFLAAIGALQIQVDRDFAPLWGGLTCVLVPSTAQPGSPVMPMGETIYVLDDSDQAGALGYHTLTQSDVPIGFCFAKTSAADDSPWQVTLSHELLEQLADPFVSTAAVVSSWQGKPAAISYEVGDPVEADSYPINGVPVSNFVTAAWFQDGAPTGAKLDYLGKLSAPLTLTPGGYVAYTNDLANWQQFQPGRVRTAKQAVLPFSRRWKRWWKGRA